MLSFFRESDSQWPAPDSVGRQELEVVVGDQHISFVTSKIGSLVDVEDSKDPDGLKLFYFLIQDLRCMVFSLIGMHFKVKLFTCVMPIHNRSLVVVFIHMQIKPI